MLSATDRDTHYIGVGALRRLYGLRNEDHVVVLSGYYDEIRYRPLPGDVHLYPRYSRDDYYDVHAGLTGTSCPG